MAYPNFLRKFMKKSNVYLVVSARPRFSILLFSFKKDSKAEYQPGAVQKAELRVKIQREFLLSAKTYEKTAFVLVG